MVLHCDLLTIRYRCLSVTASTLPKHSGVFLCSKHTLISAIHLRFFRYDVRSPRCQEGIFACDSFDARILLKEDLYCEIDRRVCFLAICCSIRVASTTGPCAALSPEKTTITAAFSSERITHRNTHSLCSHSKPHTCHICGRLSCPKLCNYRP